MFCSKQAIGVALGPYGITANSKMRESRPYKQTSFTRKISLNVSCLFFKSLAKREKHLGVTFDFSTSLLFTQVLFITWFLTRKFYPPRTMNKKRIVNLRIREMKNSTVHLWWSLLFEACSVKQNFKLPLVVQVVGCILLVEFFRLSGHWLKKQISN